MGQTGSDVLLITNDNRMFAFGKNENGCLGLGHKNDVSDEPQEINELTGKEIIGLAHGLKHVVALTINGEIYTWGDNNYGQLGTMNMFESSTPRLVGEQIISVQCGANHTLALTESGQIFAWGRNNYGQIGLGTNTNQMVPSKVIKLEPHFMTAIACGHNFSMALTSKGELFTWGNNSFGQLGNGNCTHQTMPVAVKPIPGIVIKDIVCGANHSLLLMNNGEIWSFGRNEHGQLGCPSVPVNEGSSVPVKVVCSNRFQSITSHFASNISVAMSQCGYCFVWGELSTICGEEKQPVREPRETPLNSFNDVFAVYCTRKNTPSNLWLEEEFYNSMNANASNSKPSNRVVEKLAACFNDQSSGDLEFWIDGRPIYAHRWFLKITSKYFERMLSELWLKPESNKIEISDYSYTIFMAYLRYLYTDCIEVNLDETIELLDLADCYLEDNLKEKCVNIMRNNISIDNCCRLYGVALKYGLIDFEKFVVTFVLNNIFVVFRSDGFRLMPNEHAKNMLINVGHSA